MNALPADTWYKPRDRFTFSGEPWSTDGHIAIAAECDAPERDRSAGIRHILATCTEESRFVREGGMSEPHRENLGPMAAFVGDRPIAVMIPRRTTLGIVERCKCPWCGGSGFGEKCTECDGSGRVEHECSRGNLHEHDCDDCDGEGGAGTCKRCGGSKLYGGSVAATTDLEGT